MDELKDIPEKKLQDIIWHYENLFDLEIQNGKSEEEIVESLGDIDTLINKYKDSALLTDYMKDSLNDSSDSRIYNNESNYSGNYIVSTERHSNTIQILKKIKMIQNFIKIIIQKKVLILIQY